MILKLIWREYYHDILILSPVMIRPIIGFPLKLCIEQLIY